MKTSLIAITLAAAAVTSVGTPAAAQSRTEEQRWRDAQRRFDEERRIYERERDRYEEAVRRDEEYGRYDSRDRYYETDYDAARYYRDDPRYQERVLGANDQIYRGSDGRYYCRRSDGTTGLIVGGAAGGLLGNVIDGGRSRGAGTLIGVAVGALIGREVERSREIRCR